MYQKMKENSGSHEVKLQTSFVFAMPFFPGKLFPSAPCGSIWNIQYFII